VVPLRFALVLILVFGCLVAYLTSFNATGAHAVLGPGWLHEIPMAALIVGAFLIGAASALVFGTLRDVRRSLLDYQRARAAQAHGVLDEETSPRPAAGHRRAETSGASAPHHLDDRDETLLAVAGDHRRSGRTDQAIEVYQRVLARDQEHLGALRGIRDVMLELGRWGEALAVQERLLRAVPRAERGRDEIALAGISYELGRRLLGEGNAQAAVARFREALRTRPDFLPATLVLGDAYLKMGDTREALRIWERALVGQPAPPLLSRLEHLYRADGRPARMISLYEEAAARHPEDRAIAFGLGRVYFGLAMLDEAAEQFEKLEVREPDLAAIHAYLGAIFERRGQVAEALEEYRRALGFPQTIEWPHHCSACRAVEPSWFDRCPACRAWNTAQP